MRVWACWAAGLGIRGTTRVFEVDPNTVLPWLVEAAEQVRAFAQYFLHDLHLRQVQFDERDVIQTMRRWRLVEGKRRVVFGAQAAVDQVREACGGQIEVSR
jgi:hypothetical protein